MVSELGVGVGSRVCKSVEAETVGEDKRNRQIKPNPTISKIEVEAELALWLDPLPIFFSMQNLKYLNWDNFTTRLNYPIQIWPLLP